MSNGILESFSTLGGGPERAEAANAIVGAGVAVMGHAGLMPQSVSVLGGFGPQGKTADTAMLVVQDAIVIPSALQLKLIIWKSIYTTKCLYTTSTQSTLQFLKVLAIKSNGIFGLKKNKRQNLKNI